MFQKMSRPLELSSAGASKSIRIHGGAAGTAGAARIIPFNFFCTPGGADIVIFGFGELKAAVHQIVPRSCGFSGSLHLRLKNQADNQCN